MALAAVSGAAASCASGVHVALLQEGVATAPAQRLDLAGACRLGLERCPHCGSLWLGAGALVGRQVPAPVT